jgi:hypothetical protein
MGGFLLALRGMVAVEADGGWIKRVHPCARPRGRPTGRPQGHGTTTASKSSHGRQGTHIAPFPRPHRGDPNPRREALAQIEFRWTGGAWRRGRVALTDDVIDARDERTWAQRLRSWTRRRPQRRDEHGGGAKEGEKAGMGERSPESSTPIRSNALLATGTPLTGSPVALVEVRCAV